MLERKSTDADAVLLAFLDLEGDDEALLLGIVFGQRGDHLHVGKAVLEIEAANQVAVGLDAVGIVDVVAAEEAQQVRFARLDDVAQAIGRVGAVADELDRLDAGLGAFGDREDQVDAVVRLLDDLRGDADVIAAGAAVDFGDALGVRLHHRRARSVPRGLDWISAESCSSLTFLLPSKAMRPITGFSTTVTTIRPPAAC